MRVVLAPDSFGSVQADSVAQALESGWRDVAPDDAILLAPMADGGVNFVAVLAFARPNSRIEYVAASGPTGESTGDHIVIDGSTAYVESASACGLAAL